MAKITRKGLSSGVWKQSRLQDYIKSGAPGGYIGAYTRSAKTDKIVERALRKDGLTDKEIAIWMTSTSGRHMMDNKLTPKVAKQWAKNAYDDLARWGETV